MLSSCGSLSAHNRSGILQSVKAHCLCTFLGMSPTCSGRTGSLDSPGRVVGAGLTLLWLQQSALRRGPARAASQGPSIEPPCPEYTEDIADKGNVLTELSSNKSMMAMAWTGSIGCRIYRPADVRCRLLDMSDWLRDEVMACRSTYKGGKQIEADPKLDWAGNLAHMMGAALTNRIVVREIKRYKVHCLVTVLQVSYGISHVEMSTLSSVPQHVKWASPFSFDSL